jgi:hypothetical protein
MILFLTEIRSSVRKICPHNASDVYCSRSTQPSTSDNIFPSCHEFPKTVTRNDFGCELL